MTTIIGTSGNDVRVGDRFDNIILGLSGNDTLDGQGGNDLLQGSLGDDVLIGGTGNDTLMGQEDFDVAVFAEDLDALRFTDPADDFRDAWIITRSTGRDSTYLIDVEAIETPSGRMIIADALRGADGVFRGETASGDFFIFGKAYAGPVAWLERQALGSSGNEVLVGTGDNDFINLLGGNDAADGGAGDDVLDGGTGSNFLTGGSGRDWFFTDGRGGGSTWTTIVDWEAGENLSIWGWRPGVSQRIFVESDGAEGFKGVTLHADLDGNGLIDTSVTWAGRTQADLPVAVEFSDPQLLWFIG